MKDFSNLPDGLPVPTDDGKADHLTGSLMPSVVLRGTKGIQVLLDALPQGRTVIYVYPMTGKPGVDLPTGWDEVPGARGCTPESCGFRDNFKLLQEAGVVRLYGLSNQDTEYQVEASERLNLPFELLSDANGELGEALELPTLYVEGRTFYKRLTMVILDGRIEKVFYPVFPPDRHAREILAWLEDRR